MADSRQDRAIAYANQLMGMAQQLANIRSTLNQYIIQMKNEQYADVWLALQTVPMNPDGSLGTTPDSPPNPNNPIFAPAYPALNRAIPPQDLVIGINQLLIQLSNFFSNQPVTQADYNAMIDALCA